MSVAAAAAAAAAVVVTAAVLTPSVDSTNRRLLATYLLSFYLFSYLNQTNCNQSTANPPIRLSACLLLNSRTVQKYRDDGDVVSYSTDRHLSYRRRYNFLRGAFSLSVRIQSDVAGNAGVENVPQTITSDEYLHCNK